MATIMEIAECMGVSHSTISRVINDRPGISAETRKRVRDHISREGILLRPPEARPGPSAKRVRDTTLKAVNSQFYLVLHNKISQVVAGSLPAHARALEAMERAIGAHGAGMAISFYDSRSDDFPRVLKRKDLGGVILIGYKPDEQLNNILKKHPVVTVFSRIADFWADSVHIDNTALGRMVARVLHQRGCKNVLFLGFSKQHSGEHERAAAFKNELLSNSVQVNCLWPETEPEFANCPTPLPYVDFTGIFVKYLKANPAPDGLFIMTDMLIQPIYSALRTTGIEPVKDITIATACNETSPEVARELGYIPFDCLEPYVAKRAIEHLLWRSRNRDEPQQHIVITPKVIL